MTTESPTLTAVAAWPRRLRFVLATGILWALLQYVAGPLVLPNGLDRPLVLSASHAGLLGGLLVVLIIWAGAALATLIIGTEQRAPVLLAIGLALALWAAQGGRAGGTIDDWLILRNQTPGVPRGAPYWALIGDYIYLSLAVAGAYAIASALAPRGEPGGLAGTLRQAFRPAPAAGQKPHAGPAALLATVAVAGVVIFFLTGPALAQTRRGQVYFAVFVGFLAATFLASHFFKIRDPLWYWPAPLLLGLIGLVVAGLSPDLLLAPSGQFRPLDVIPAWGLVRPLPIEMVGVGLVATFWSLHAPGRPHADDTEG